MLQQAVKSKRPVKFIDFTDEIRKSLLMKKRDKNPRVKLESWQLCKLLEAYEEDTHPSQKTKNKLSSMLSLSLKSVQIWFQNKRAKEKSRREREEIEETDRKIDRSINRIYTNPLTHTNSILTHTNSISTMQPVEVESVQEEEMHKNLFLEPSSFVNELDTFPSFSASYDDCYNAISSIADIQTSSFEKGNPSFQTDDPFLSFSSFPLTKTPSFAQSNSPSSNSLSLPDIYAEKDKYRFQFRNKSIIYSREEDSLDLLNCIYNQSNNVHK